MLLSLLRVPTLGAATVDEAQKINEDKAKELLKDVNVGDGDKKLYVQSSLKVEPTAYDAAKQNAGAEDHSAVPYCSFYCCYG